MHLSQFWGGGWTYNLLYRVKWVRKRKINIVSQCIYTESRKMVLKIYLQGNNGETDIENRLMDMGSGEDRVRCMERVTWKLTLPYVK